MATIYFIYLVTLLIPSLIAIVLWRSTQREYRPMLAFPWLLLFMEICRSFSEEGSSLSAFGYNLHYLLELLLLLLLAQRWGTFRKQPALLPLLVLSAIIAVAMEKFIAGWDLRTSWVRVAFAAIIVCLALDFLVRIPSVTTVPLWKNPVMLFSIAIGLGYAIGGLFEIGLAFTRGVSPSFAQNAFLFGIIVNGISNLIILMSLLCLSKKVKFSFQ